MKIKGDAVHCRGTNIVMLTGYYIKLQKSRFHATLPSPKIDKVLPICLGENLWVKNSGLKLFYQIPLLRIWDPCDQLVLNQELYSGV